MFNLLTVIVCDFSEEMLEDMLVVLNISYFSTLRFCRN